MGELTYGKGGWGACSSHQALLGWGCAASASAAPAPGLPPEMQPGAQSRTQAAGGAAGALRGSQVTCEEAGLGGWRLRLGAE